MSLEDKFAIRGHRSLHIHNEDAVTRQGVRDAVPRLLYTGVYDDQ